MPSRAAFIVFSLCAALAAGFVFFVTERDGDPASRIEGVRKRIADASALLDKHTVRIRSDDGPKPGEPWRAGYVLEKPDGTKLTVDAPRGATPRQLEIAADQMISSRRSDFVLVESAWTEAEGWWEGLTWGNRRAAERMTLSHFPSKPEMVSTYDWDARRPEAAFSVEEDAAHNLSRIGYATVTFFAVLALFLVVLAACSWLWRALLARVRELSRAVRGERQK